MLSCFLHHYPPHPVSSLPGCPAPPELPALAHRALRAQGGGWSAATCAWDGHLERAVRTQPPYLFTEALGRRVGLWHGPSPCVLWPGWPRLALTLSHGVAGDSGRGRCGACQDTVL